MFSACCYVVKFARIMGFHFDPCGLAYVLLLLFVLPVVHIITPSAIGKTNAHRSDAMCISANGLFFSSRFVFIYSDILRVFCFLLSSHFWCLFLVFAIRKEFQT